ncbi:MAG: glycoside hydrolase [Bryobacteraceae bacterium]|nr:glycoside hydrolase [Bryobacteraceae bacterium]
MWFLALAAALVAVPNPAGEASGPVNLYSGSKLYLSWVEKTGPKRHELRFATREPGGWSKPATIAGGENWFVNWADFPSLVELADGTLMAHWLERSSAEQYSYNLRVARSADGGKTWNVFFAPAPQARNAYTGFVSMMPSPTGLALAYLAPRETAGGGHDTKLHFAEFRADGTPVSNSAVDLDVCSCCQTGVAWTDAGPVVVYRDHTRDIRDISIVRRVGNNWTAPAAVHADNWKIPGCPVNGPAIAAEGKRVAVAWYTGGEKAVKLAFSDDAGATFSPPLRIDGGHPEGRVDLLLTRTGAVVSWLERKDDKQLELRARTAARTGQLGAPATVATLPAGRSSGFPRMKSWNGKLWFAWKDRRVETAELTQPLAEP